MSSQCGWWRPREGSQVLPVRTHTAWTMDEWLTKPAGDCSALPLLIATALIYYYRSVHGRLSAHAWVRATAVLLRQTFCAPGASGDQEAQMANICHQESREQAQDRDLPSREARCEGCSRGSVRWVLRAGESTHGCSDAPNTCCATVSFDHGLQHNCSSSQSDTNSRPW